MASPLATLDHTTGDLTAALGFLKHSRWVLREVWMVRVGPDWYQVIDVNKDCLEIRGIGYRDTDVVQLLRGVNAAFDPATIHDPTDEVYKNS
jgi:hypothetical protein